MSMTPTTRWLAPLLVLTSLAALRAAEAPADVPQLKVIERYLGNWDDKILVKQSPWSPQEQNLTATAVGTKVLAGRYVQLKSSSSDNAEGMSMITYDTGLNSFASWWWNSLGHHNNSLGEWNEQTRTMSWKGTLPGDFTLLSTDRFPDDDTRQWHVLVKDNAGATVFDMSGTMKRKK